MPGLLELLTGGGDPAKQQGLLEAAAALMQAGQPSRAPISTMQAINNAQRAYLGGQQDYAQTQFKNQSLQQAFQLNDLKLQDAKSDLANQERKRKQEAEIAKAVAALNDSQEVSAAPGGTQASVGYAAPGNSPFMQRMAELGGSAPPAGKFGAQEYYDAALQAGLAGAGSIETSNQIIDRVNRFGENPATAARALLSGRSDSGGAMSPRVGAPDWMQNYHQSGYQTPNLPAQIPNPPAQLAPRVNQTDLWVERQQKIAQIRLENGDVEGALKLIENIQKIRPKFNTTFQKALGADNKMHYYQASDDGAPPRELALGVAPELTEVTLGDRKKFVDKNGIAPGTEYMIGQSPDSRAAGRRDAAGGGADIAANIDPKRMSFMVDQALSGDSTVYQNLGRGKQGAANLLALRGAVADEAQKRGLSGADLAAINADYQGQKAGLRTAATISARIENAASEVGELMPLAIEAGRKVARSGVLVFGKGQNLFDNQTNDPDFNRFAAGNIALATAYAGVMARGGKATVQDIEHARDVLGTQKSQAAYEAVADMMTKEVAAAKAAPGHVRANLRSQISGKGNDHAPTTVSNPVSAPAGQFSIKTPDGRTFNFPDAKALANFKLTTGLK
jgi:hypothetical protein